MSLPSPLSRALHQALGAPPRNVRAMHGGDINRAARFQASEGTYLVKWNPAPLPGMFAAEAKGLVLLAEAQAIRVPKPFVHAARTDGCPAYLVMEWIEPAGSGHGQHAAGITLGRGLAEQHRVTAPAYGLDHDNYCGSTRQANDRLDSWIEFYGQRRLGFQMELAAEQGRLPPARRKRLELLIARLDRWIDENAAQPSLLHGDLWGGNWMIASRGEPVIYDPAVYFGDREAELAMCHLFGGFPSSFFRAYDESWLPAPGRDERVPLYQLYHLLNHLNLFGESYGRRVDGVLRHYVG